jgi:hypothetical protein
MKIPFALIRIFDREFVQLLIATFFLEGDKNLNVLVLW